MARAWERRAELGILLQGTRRFLHSNPYFASRVEQSPKVVEEAGKVLTERFSGWRVGLVTSEGGLAKATGLPFDRPGPPVPLGGIKVTLWRTGPLP